jgi:branched-chain amino acid transport system substrate-binding protein
MSTKGMLTRLMGLVGAVLLVAGHAGAVSAQPKEYRIGAIMELSGPFSQWGAPMRDAIQLAIDNINAAGGVKGVPLRLVIYDGRSRGTEAALLAKRLVEQDRVLAIIGPGTSPTTMPVIPYVQQVGVSTLSMGSSDRIIEPPTERRWMFRPPYGSRHNVEKLVEHFKARGIKKVGFMSVNNAYGDTGREEFVKAAGPAGIEVVASEKFGGTDTDMKPQLTKIRGLAPQAIVVWSIPPAASIVQKNRAELGIDNIPFYHDNGASLTPQFIDLAGGAAEGAHAVVIKIDVVDDLPGSDSSKAQLLKFREQFESRFGSQVGGLYAEAYDCVLLIAKGLETAGDNREKLRGAIEQIRGLVGMAATYNLSPTDHGGVSSGDLFIGRVQKEKWTIVK